MAHTPGPWFLNEYMRHQIRAPAQPGEREEHCIAYTYPSSANSGANARLIAAAPELLAACEATKAWCDHYANCPRCGGTTFCAEAMELFIEMRSHNVLALAKVRGSDAISNPREGQ